MSSIPKSGPGGPSHPETQVIYTEYRQKASFLFVEDTPNEGAWIEIDDQHVCQQEDWE